jgi:hypothetical protein
LRILGGSLNANLCAGLGAVVLDKCVDEDDADGIDFGTELLDKCVDEDDGGGVDFGVVVLDECVDDDGF